jgi:hypothetical protein
MTARIDWTPQEIADHKMRWLPGHTVIVHSDLDWKCKDWCRKHLHRSEWSMSKYTHVYAHTFHFELNEYAYNFSNEFKEWVDVGIK